MSEIKLFLLTLVNQLHYNLLSVDLHFSPSLGRCASNQNLQNRRWGFLSVSFARLNHAELQINCQHLTHRQFNYTQYLGQT